MSRNRLERGGRSGCQKPSFTFLCLLGLVALLILSEPQAGLARSQTGPPAPKKVTAKLSREKKYVLDWLGQKEQLEYFGRISDRIWSYAELGLQEFKSSQLLADTLEQAGFRVERGLAGLPTCFVATYGQGPPVIGFLGEFDALPMLSQKGRVPRKDPVVEGAPGHGCGHNTMGTAAVAAAIATKQAMEKFGLKGTIKVFGSPAEEILASRPYMVRAGLFQDVAAVIDNHSSSDFGTAYGISGNAVISVIFTFKGKTAHSAGAPWAGRSALDAVELMNVATNYLREHLNPAHRLHYVILEGGQAPNVVPDRASVWYYVRNTDDQLESMYERVVNCARAAALASGTELAEIRVLSATHQFHGNKALAELIQKNIELVGLPAWEKEEEEFTMALQQEVKAEEKGLAKEVSRLREPRDTFIGGGSTDVGEVTLVVPTATVRFPASVPGAIGHHWSTVASVYGSIAWKGLNAGAKAMALTALDLLTRPEELKKVRAEFEEYMKTHSYKSFLPPEATPPLELNQALMEKWRKLLEAHEIKD
ncbi:MAG: amidohydrolase [Candidatus Saccharicenans sp.]|jgi:aminobenzoyl-glutamate utilization protein B|nr:amidohydrolase [Candidatus Saccharicenans sp.]MDH7492988.1 amidohydrolase [Candidatus Saccharicenans sp.]